MAQVNCLLYQFCCNYNYDDDGNSQYASHNNQLDSEKFGVAKQFYLIDAHLQYVDKHGDFI